MATKSIGGSKSKSGNKKKPQIKIKDSKKGSFTKYCRSKGHKGVTNECIAQGKKSKSPAIRKKAVFAQNSRKWNKK